MTQRTRKWLFAGAMAVVGFATDIGGQIVTGKIVDLNRTVIIGLLVGAFARGLGAIFAACFTDTDTE